MVNKEFCHGEKENGGGNYLDYGNPWPRCENLCPLDTPQRHGNTDSSHIGVN